MPEVPPNSSSTMAIERFCSMSWVIILRAKSVSGAKITGLMRVFQSTSVTKSSLTWMKPITLSISPRYTTILLKPLRLKSDTKSSRLVSVTSTATMSLRGTMQLRSRVSLKSSAFSKSFTSCSTSRCSSSRLSMVSCR